MESVIRYAKCVGAVVVGVIFYIVLYRPIYFLLGNVFEEILGASILNPKIANIGADFFSPMCAGFITVKLAPHPKRKAIIWLPGILLAMAVAGVFFGKFSRIADVEWVFGIVIGLVGSVLGGSLAARGK